MANTQTLTGDDTLVINERSFTDFANGNVGELTLENDYATLAVGKNRNIIIAKDEQGNVVGLTLRLIKGSPDDIFLNTYFNTYRADSATFVLGAGKLEKRLGDGQGNVLYDTYYFTGLHFVRPPFAAVINANGDTDQAVTVYTLRGLIGDRAL